MLSAENLNTLTNHLENHKGHTETLADDVYEVRSIIHKYSDWLSEEKQKELEDDLVNLIIQVS